MLRPSKTVHALVWSPTRAKRILVVSNKADDFAGSDKGKPAGFGLPGGGVEALVKIPGIKQTEMRFQKIEELGYRVLRVEKNHVYGNTLAEREKRFQAIMRLYPFGSELEFLIQKNGITETRTGIFVREERLEETATREAFAETEHEIGLVLRNGSPIYAEKNEKPEHCKYTVLGEIKSPYSHEIEESDESLGIAWLNLFDSLPQQLARIREKRPECNEILYYAHALKIMQFLQNRRMRIEISAKIKEEMASDHPKMDAPYGKSFLLVGDTPDESAVHPSWFWVLRTQRDVWRSAMRYLRDNNMSGTREKWDEAVETLAKTVRKNEPEHMESRVLKTAVTAPEVAALEIIAPSKPFSVLAEEALLAAAEITAKEPSPNLSSKDNSRPPRESDENFWARFTRPEVFAEWKAGK